MTAFIINDENDIVALSATEEAVLADPAVISFDSQDALATASAGWPMARFVEIFNSIPGNAPVKKFADRTKAVGRIWRAIQPLAEKEPGEPIDGADAPAQATEQASDAPAASSVNPKAKKERKAATKSATAAKTAKTPKTAADKPASERSNKKAAVLALMKRAEGATLAEIAELTGWQKHTIRGFVSVLGSKGGGKIESSKNAGGERCYKVAK